MKKGSLILVVGLGLLGLIALGIAMNSLWQARTTETIGRTPEVATVNITPNATREEQATVETTRKSNVDWENATLDQIKFGKSRTIFSQDAQIKIWSWLPDNRRLLVELVDINAKDVGSTYRIVTLDVKTGEILEFGRRGDENTPPSWIEQTSSVAYIYSNWQTGEGPRLRIGHSDGQVQDVAAGYAAFSVSPTTGEVYYRVANPNSNPLRLVNLNQAELSPTLPFPLLSLPPGSPLIDPKGQFLAIVGSPTLGIIDLANGEIKNYDIVSQPQSGKTIGTSIEQWSPNSTQIGLILTQDGGNAVTQVPPLAVFDVKTGQIRLVNLPVPGVVEFDWGPMGRFILVKAANGIDEQHFPNPNTFWLVDAKDQTYKPIDSLATNDGTQSWMAWNAKGQLAWVKNLPEGLAIAITEIAPER